MSARGSWTSYNLRSFLELFYRYKSKPNANVFQVRSSVSKIDNPVHGRAVQQGFQLFTTTNEKWTKRDTRVMVNYEKGDSAPAPTPPTRPNFLGWARWFLGSVLTLLLPFWRQKWEKLKMIEAEAEMVVEGAESVAKVVEKAAMATEKLSGEMAENLPENGKLKATAMLIEKVSKETARDAQLTQNFLLKVDELTHDLDDLERIVEPALEKLIQRNPKSDEFKHNFGSKCCE